MAHDPSQRPPSRRGFKNKHRKGILMLADLFLITAAYLGSWMMINGRVSLTEYLPTLLLSWGLWLVVFFVTFSFFGMYDSLWRYAEAYEYVKCLAATLVAAGVFCLVTWLVLKPPRVAQRIPISVYFLSAMLAGMCTLMLRMLYRAWRTGKSGVKTTSGMKKVLLVGAGETGNAVLGDIAREPNSRYNVVCIVDDDPHKVGRAMHRVKVSGTTQDIPKLVDRHGIDVIIMAVPGIANKDRRRITNICAKTKCQLKKVPDLYSFVTDKSSILAEMQDVSVEDLLGREVVDMRPKSTTLTDKTVLVTGAGGSIGSELCRQIAVQRPARLVLLDICENGLYDIEQELRYTHGDTLALAAEVASVRDAERLATLFERYRFDIVYHAAAHKHVPLMENAPEEAVKNNIFGTLNVAQMSDRYKVGRFVMISTDKAVNPTNVMGATKRVCEMIVQCLASMSKTEFVAVRFGNVLGSSGSVIPLFRSQIAAGGPVTVTHPNIIRYFMTIPEAVSLVLTAGEMAKGGEIFVLDMGEPVKILDLAENLIRLSGYEPYTDIEIEFTGLRPGEKLFEELLMDEEGLRKTKNQKIYIGAPIAVSMTFLLGSLSRMKAYVSEKDTGGLLECLRELVPGYHSEGGE